MGKKPIVSVTYKNERISVKKNSLAYIKCVLRLSCVIHELIYGCFMGCTVNGFLSMLRPSALLISNLQESVQVNLYIEKKCDVFLCFWCEFIDLVPGGYLRNFWVGVCRWDPGTLNLYQS